MPDGGPAGISASLEYAADLFDQATVEALAARLTRLLARLSPRPDQPLSALDVLDRRRAAGAGAGGTTRRGRCRR